MTPEQVRYGAQVALYLKFMAARMMEAEADALDLAALFLDILHAKEGKCAEEAQQATLQDAEDFLALVASAYDPNWGKLRDGLPGGRANTFDPHAALFDLASTPWLWRILPMLRGRKLTEAEALAHRFLRLRERIRAWGRPLNITRQHAAQLLQKLDAFIQDLMRKYERTRSHDVIPISRPRTRRPGTRTLGF